MKSKMRPGGSICNLSFVALPELHIFALQREHVARAGRAGQQPRHPLQPMALVAGLPLSARLMDGLLRWQQLLLDAHWDGRHGQRCAVFNCSRVTLVAHGRC